MTEKQTVEAIKQRLTRPNEQFFSYDEMDQMIKWVDDHRLKPNQEVINWFVYPYESPVSQDNDAVYLVRINGKTRLELWNNRWHEIQRDMGVSEFKWTPIPNGGDE